MAPWLPISHRRLGRENLFVFTEAAFFQLVTILIRHVWVSTKLATTVQTLVTVSPRDNVIITIAIGTAHLTPPYALSDEDTSWPSRSPTKPR